jgi:hypothetical protein
MVKSGNYIAKLQLSHGVSAAIINKTWRITTSPKDIKPAYFHRYRFLSLFVRTPNQRSLNWRHGPETVAFNLAPMVVAILSLFVWYNTCAGFAFFPFPCAMRWLAYSWLHVLMLAQS